MDMRDREGGKLLCDNCQWCVNDDGIQCPCYGDNQCEDYVSNTADMLDIGIKDLRADQESIKAFWNEYLQDNE